MQPHRTGAVVQSPGDGPPGLGAGGGGEGPRRASEAAGPIDEVPRRRSQSAVTTPRVVPAGNTGRARLMR